MGEVTQINIRIGADQKSEWKEYLDESGEYTTLTGLIRSAVEAEINGDHHEAQESPAVANDIDKVKTELERVRKDVSWLRNQEQDSRDISGVAVQVRDELVTLPRPTSSVDIPDDVEDEQAYRRLLAAESIILPDDTAEAEASGRNDQTLESIASRVGATSEEVKEAIDHLKDDFLPVVEVERQGEIHYFMER